MSDVLVALFEGCTMVHRPTQRCFETAGTVRRDTICKQVIVQLTTGVARLPWDHGMERNEQITSRLTDWQMCLADVPGRCAWQTRL